MPARTLLLIDDDTATRGLLTVLLEHAGWQVSEAGSGDEAVQWLRGTEAAVVLCDLRMPGLSGPALAGAMRAVGCEAMLIAMTGTPLDRVPEGYDGLLIKPFGADAVEAVLAGYVRGAMQTGEADARGHDPRLAFEEGVLLRLERTVPAERLRALLTMVADDAEERVRSMTEAARRGDRLAFGAAAHALRGSCAVVGARRLQELAARAEQEGTGQDGTEWNGAADFCTEIEAIRLMLRTLSDRTATAPRAKL